MGVLYTVVVLHSHSRTDTTVRERTEAFSGAATDGSIILSVNFNKFLKVYKYSPEQSDIQGTLCISTTIYDIFLFIWSPYGIGQTIIFLPCGYFFLLSFFFSSPNLSRRRLDVCHTSTVPVALSANLRCRYETCCTRLAENT